MRTVFFVILAMLITLPAFGQTVYYNHPKGVPIGPFYKGEQATVAKLTLPAGTYHAIFKSQFESNPAFCANCGGPVFCNMYGTGIPNVTNPYLLDAQKITIQQDNVNNPAAGNMVMEAAFSTTGGTLTVQCTDQDMGALQSARTSLSAAKITTLVRQ
jgi:hypothetical protein